MLAALVVGRAELIGVPGKVRSRNYVCEWFTDLEVQLEFFMALLTEMMINVASSQARDLASSGGVVVCDEMLAWVVYLVVHNRAGGCEAYLRG